MMFQDLEAKDKNWHKEMTSVLWALRTNINRATRDTLFSLVSGADAVLPPEIYLKSAMVAHFNPEDQAKARELDADLLEKGAIHRYPICANIRRPWRGTTIKEWYIESSISGTYY
jgi:hypothetical protein